jgi:uncharacterized membrane protein YhaH (DUF805 family)
VLGCFFIYIGLVTAMIIPAMITGNDKIGNIGAFFYFFANYLFPWAMVIPYFSVQVRRLHDTNRSGWLILLVFIPFLGDLLLLYYNVVDSQPAKNRYGSNPKEKKITVTSQD